MKESADNTVIKSEKSIISPPAVIPNNKLKNIQVRIAFIACLFLFKANFSETITITAMFNPDVATVMKNRYTAITKLNTPTASEPI